MSRHEFDPRSLNPQPLDGSGEAQRMTSADSLREQAAACRRLANRSRTRSGFTSMVALGDHFDEQARKLDPASQRR